MTQSQIRQTISVYQAKINIDKKKHGDSYPTIKYYQWKIDNYEKQLSKLK